MAIRVVQVEWGMFLAGEAVIYRGRNAHVVSVPQNIVSMGKAPIMFDDESGCFHVVPVDDLNKRFK